MAKVLFFIFLAEIWNTVGQIFLKQSTNTLERPHLKTLESYFQFVKQVLKKSGIWLGLGSLAIGLVFWLMALSGADLSIVFPVGSMQYILTLVAARIFLKEKIDWMKLAGTLLVVVGIILIVKS